MNTKTHLANVLEAASEKARYDASVKKLFSNKEILAWILKYTTKEFKDYSIEVIQNCIEGEPQISNIPVYPGKQKMEAITGLPSEDKIPNEGEATYDIRFYAITPDSKNHIKLIVNIEIQNDFYPGYDLMARAIFYCSRMISAQLDTEFTDSNYNDIKKVYSIWICADAPEYAKNTITLCEMTQKQIHGNYPKELKSDLLSAILVGLGIPKGMNLEQLHPLVGMLTTLLSEEYNVEEKKKRLKDKYDMKMHKQLEKEMNSMCNLSDGVEKRGLERGLKQGIEQGLQAMVETLQPILHDFESVYNAVISNEAYKNVTMEDVRKYYNS